MNDLISKASVCEILSDIYPMDGERVVEVEKINKAYDAVLVLPGTEERKKGKWDERSVFDTEGSDIAQMQSAKCSVCGKYHTTPYLYFFDNFNYCPNCGARMVDDDIS